MKRLIANYTFDATLGKVVFTDYPTIKLERILDILNVTRGVGIYLPLDPDLAGQVTSNILQLNFDTNLAGMANGDKLQIYYDDDLYDIGGKITDTAVTDPTAQSNVMGFLKGILSIFADIWDSSIHAFQFTEVNKRAGADPDVDVVKVEQRFSYATELSANGVLVNGAGFLNVLFINCTTAGKLIIRDGTTNTSPIIKTLDVPVGIYNLPFNILFLNGLYADFVGGGGMVGNVNVSKRP